MRKLLLVGCILALAFVATPVAEASDVNCNGPGDDSCGNNPTTNQGGQGGSSESSAKAKAIATSVAVSSVYVKTNQELIGIQGQSLKNTVNTSDSLHIAGDSVRVFASAPMVAPPALAAGMCGWGIGFSGSDGKAGAGLGFSKAYECPDFVRARAALLLRQMAMDTNDARFADAALRLLANNKEAKKALIDAGLYDVVEAAKKTETQKIAADHALVPDVLVHDAWNVYLNSLAR